jgi:AAA+ ATPase superfamily predicted ATPase
MFRFWYRFVPTNISLIQNRLVDAAYRNVSEHLTDYMGTVFEEICKQYLWKLNREDKCAIAFRDLGRWWGGSPITKSEVEIDILAVSAKDEAIFCECKWTNDDISLSVLETLLERGKLFSFNKKYYYLFAKSGFTKGCTELAKEQGNVALISYKEM